MKLTTEDVIRVIKKNEKTLNDYGIKEIYLFGSVVRGQAKETSDVDFFVVFEETAEIGYFKLLEIQSFLESELKTKVDLGTKKSLHRLLRDQILKEALRVA